MWSLFARDIRLNIRAGGGALTGVIFFLAVIATIPFGVVYYRRQARAYQASLHAEKTEE